MKPGTAVTRPPTVHANAEQLESGQWLIDETPNGEYAVWSFDGTLVQRARYVDGRAVLEEKYNDGTLHLRKEHGPGDKLVQTFFWGGAKPPVPRSATLYLNAQKDVEETHFDEQGNRLYSTRREEVAPQHLRRYDDGKLMFEAQWSADPKQPPAKVAYYDRDGNEIIRYAPAGKGTGAWELVEEGDVVDSLPADDEHDRNKYGTWDRFFFNPQGREPADRIAEFLDDAKRERRGPIRNRKTGMRVVSPSAKAKAADAKAVRAAKAKAKPTPAAKPKPKPKVTSARRAAAAKPANAKAKRK